MVGRSRVFDDKYIHKLYRIYSSMIGTHQLHLANADMAPGVVPDSIMIGTHQVPLANADRYDTWCKYLY